MMPPARSFRRASDHALLVLMCAVVLLTPHHSRDLAYIGPGAGFAFLGSLTSIIAGFLVTLFSLVTWPFRIAWRFLRHPHSFRNARVKKVIFLGLDGLDPRLTERYMDQGKLPNLARLKADGSYSRLRTTFPALSPVAWATFATGVNPAKHNIFDFLNRNTKSYVPELATARVRPAQRVLRAGKFRIPLSRPIVEPMRRSQPFWKLLGDRRIGSTILRVPVTFPPDEFDGRLLSAMSTPDLRGTQGTFSQFTTRIAETTFESGQRYPLERNAAGFAGSLEGPDDLSIENGTALRIPFQIRARSGTFELEIQDQHFPLLRDEYTPWIKLRFVTAAGLAVHGIARFLLTETEPHFSLYASPVQIDPEKPALPISHPAYYAAYLAKRVGAFSTLGMAEDTWALNEGAIDNDEFLKQAYSLMEEREAMFRVALETTRRGVVACVFDTSDRIQHMFFRFLDDPQGARAIEDLYQRMDRLVGIAREFEDRDTLLFVLSDHGFCSFRRGVNLNSWLRDHGYLALKDGRGECGRYFEGVDWTRTRAFTLGLGGVYLNLKGREAQGIVESGEEADALIRELTAKLTGLPDPERNSVAIRAVYAARDLYRGPYSDEAPDLIIGYADGYRTSWDAAVGKIAAAVFEDNRKAWSGDHCVDPALVPGVLFSNRKMDAANPGIEDMAPTVLRMFGIAPPPWMDGHPVFHFD
jgi:predicted AlkP superfamily phosphohydrolase/phosphomutase